MRERSASLGEMIASHAQELYATALDNSSDLIFLADPDGLVHYLNDTGKRHFGLGEVENVVDLDLPLWFFFCGAYREKVEARCRRACEKRAVEKVVCECEGTTYELMLIPVNGSSEVRSLVCIGRDVTEFVRAVQAADRLSTELREQNQALQSEIRQRIETEKELAEAQNALVNAAREAGMAEVATTVLHNAGNVINSINVSVNVFSESAREMRVEGLAKAIPLLEEEQRKTAAEGTAKEGSRFSQVVAYLSKLSKMLGRQKQTLLDELDSVAKNMDHLKAIISLQQSRARGGDALTPARPGEILDEAIKITFASLERHGVHVEYDCEDIPSAMLDRHRVLQILTNLISNAKHALKPRGPNGRKNITVRLSLPGEGRLRYEVIDDGVGIPAENLEKIFSYGFTTKKNGHGFGLHGSVLAAKEMGGSLEAFSDGEDRGARFVLEVPYRPITS